MMKKVENTMDEGGENADEISEVFLYDE